MNRYPSRIVATRHVDTSHGIVISRVELAEPPVAVVPEIDSVMAGWWFRDGGYPVGEMYGTALDQ